MKKIKKKIENFIYKHIAKWYVKLTNKRHWNFKTLTDGYEYFVTHKFRNCHYAITNPIECVYFALNEVYSGTNVRVQGITMDYEESSDYIKVNILSERPGLVIGYHGRDIDNLTEILTNYFGKKVKVNVVEFKTNFVYRNY